MQLDVPGARLSTTLGEPSGSAWALPSPVHWIVADVGLPGASDSNATVIRDSGVSENEMLASLPLPHVARLPTATVCDEESSTARHLIREPSLEHVRRKARPTRRRAGGAAMPHHS